MLLGGFWCKVGGHSLLATQATSRIRGTFGIDLPLATVCDQPTIADLATVIGSTMLGTDANSRNSHLVDLASLGGNPTREVQVTERVPGDGQD
jgi:hypothetical protein